MNKHQIPHELRIHRQWVCWRIEQDKRSGRDCKVPYSPITGKRASPSDPFVFTKESGIVGIDIDNCIENGVLNKVATDILSLLPPTYIEYSPSSKGCTSFCKAHFHRAATAKPMSKCTAADAISLSPDRNIKAHMI
jgi:primase-polymerase (primpol)-like protein